MNAGQTYIGKHLYNKLTYSKLPLTLNSGMGTKISTWNISNLALTNLKYHIPISVFFMDHNHLKFYFSVGLEKRFFNSFIFYLLTYEKHG